MAELPEQLILDIYEAGSSENDRQQLFDGIRRFLRAETMCLQLLDKDLQGAQYLSVKLEDSFISGYKDFWWRKDIWTQLGSHMPGRALISEYIDPYDQYGRSAIYNDFARHHGGMRYIAGAIIPVDGSVAALGLHRPVGMEDFDQGSVRSLSLLLPHLQRSLQLMSRIQDLETESAASRLALDTLAYGLIAVDRNCRPLVINTRARKLLAASAGISGGAYGRPIEARLPSTTSELHGLVTSVTARPPAAGGAVLLPRGGGELPLVALVSPLVGTYLARLHVREPAALLVLKAPEDKPVLRTKVLSDLYGLTAAEARLADLLSDGARLEDIGARLGVRITTLRSQLRSILQKTETDRQSTLIRLLARLSD